jgi:phosphoribosylamine--glycine ligase
MPRIQNDLLEVLIHCTEGRLGEVNLHIDSRSAACVMCVSGGYPESYEKGKTISGIHEVTDGLLFHAGTKKEGDSVVSSGGRVIAVTSLDDRMEKALEKSYASISKLSFERMYYRKDIGFDLQEG